MKTNLLLAVAGLLFLTSCTRPSTDRNINVEKVNEVLQQRSGYVQKSVLLSMLNEDEKAYLWKTHIREYMDVASFSKEQKGIIREVLDFIQPSVFRDENLQHYTGQLALLEYRAKQLFTLKDYYIIFESWTKPAASITATSDAPSLTDPGGGSNCYCRSDSYCALALGSDLAGCLWNTDMNICLTTSSGCGLLDLFSCRGKCTKGNIIYDL